MIATLFKQKADLYGLPREDLANAVSCLQHEDAGETYSAQEYRNMLAGSVPDLWIAAEEVLQKMKMMAHD